MSKGVTPALFPTVNVRPRRVPWGRTTKQSREKEYPDGNDRYGQVLQW
jgi:hypothetical protein